tara:strand:+ start:153 stop:851 length:699 start_codon:yes stop_codon:yes gene_type:complete
MSFIKKHLFTVLISLFCNFSFCNELEDLDYVSALDKPTFSINSPDRQITLTGESSSSLDGSEFIIQIPNFKLNSNIFSVNINSEDAIFNKDVGYIKFKDSVKLQSLSKKDNLLISSEEIALDFTNKTFSSKEEVLTNLNDLEIKSLGMELTQKGDNLYAEFSKGSFQIKNAGTINKGYAEKLYIIFEDNKIILEEEALLDQDGFIIKSDLIHYDYSLNKIIKSINSSIENNS